MNIARLLNKSTETITYKELWVGFDYGLKVFVIGNDSDADLWGFMEKDKTAWPAWMKMWYAHLNA